MHLLAHGLGPIKDLPVPTWLFFWGAAGRARRLVRAARRCCGASRCSRGTPPGGRRRAASAFLLSTPLRVAVQTVSVLLLVLVFLTALLGDERPVREPRADLGLRRLLARPAAALGAVRRRLAGAQPMARDRRRLRLDARAAGREPARVEPYPERLGRWPAALALFAFVSLELAYKDPSAPLTLAWAIAIYTS